MAGRKVTEERPSWLKRLTWKIDAATEWLERLTERIYALAERIEAKATEIERRRES